MSGPSNLPNHPTQAWEESTCCKVKCEDALGCNTTCYSTRRVTFTYDKVKCWRALTYGSLLGMCVALIGEIGYAVFHTSWTETEEDDRAILKAIHITWGVGLGVALICFIVWKHFERNTVRAPAPTPAAIPLTIVRSAPQTPANPPPLTIFP